MKRGIEKILFDKEDHELLVIVNEVLNRDTSRKYIKNLLNPYLHPHGIKEMAASRELRIAYAVVHLLNSLEVGEEKERLAVARQVQRLAKKYPEIYVCTCASLSFGRDFCGSAKHLYSLEINQRGELLFCCDALVQGAVVGSLCEESALDLYKKAKKMSANLGRIRRQMIAKGLSFDGFDSCDFCNRILNEPAFNWELHHDSE